MRAIWSTLGVTAAGLAALAITLTPGTASACGGFFCSQVPIDQQGEQIVFAVEGNTITATIQIAYAGEAEDFAWVIPVATKPTIDVAPQQLFQELAWRTAPQWYLNWTDRGGQCGWWSWELDAAADGPPSQAGGGNGVNVVSSEEVGPYETVVLESSDPHALKQWLDDNGFDQPDEAVPLIDHYLKQDMLFLALKLKKGADTGDIQPVSLTFQEQSPCVPLVLTQIAAVPDMPVRLWVFGDERAVPTNWFGVEINEKKIDWMNYGSNYDDVVTQAVNEAAGHGFVTEFARDITQQSLNGLEQALYFDGKFDTAKLETITDAGQFMDELLAQGFPRDALMQQLLRVYIPMPQSLVDQGLEERDFYNNIEQYLDQMPQDWTFTPVPFVADLKERVIEPLKAAQDMVNSHPYLTRLYTTVSPDEMNRDPFFGFNPDLPEVSNVHYADAQGVCDDTDPNVLAKVILTLESGESFEIEGPFDWNTPVEDPVPNEPAAKKILLLGETGQGTIVDPAMVGEVDRKLDTETPGSVAQQIPELELPPVESGVSGCDAGGSSTPAALLLSLMALLSLAALRRRRS